VYDILWTGDGVGIISQGDGFANVNGELIELTGQSGNADKHPVEFRLVVFRPFKGEVMNARIRRSTPAGINRKFPPSLLPEFVLALTNCSENRFL